MTLEISVPELSHGAQGDDVARVHRALQALSRSVPVSERKQRVLGAGTVAVIKALQAELDLSATGVVDAATVRAINGKLDRLATDQRVVRGLVRDANGEPFATGSVQIFSQGTNGEPVIGKSPVDATEGSYQIAYQPPPNSNGRVDLRVAVLNSADAVVETIPSGASILIDAGPLEVVNFVLSREANQPRSEFEQIVKDLTPLLGDRELVDLQEEEGRYEISFLAIRSGYPAELVAALVLAHRLEKETKKPAEMFYGLIRQGLPSDLRALHGTDQKILLNALQAAVEKGVVPKEVGGKKIEEHLAGFAPSATNELRPLLGRLLNTNALNNFAARFLENSQDPAAFWQNIASDPAFASRADKLKLTVQVAGLLNANNDKQARLIAKVLERPDITQAPDLARLNQEDWKSLIQAQDGVVPDETPGANAKEQIETYARQIVRQVEAAFSARFLAERDSEATADGSRVATFLRNQPAFHLKTTYLDKFIKVNPGAAQALRRRDRERLANLQRVHRVISGATASSPKTSIAEETIALTRKGVRSAYQIARMDPTVFAQQNQEIFSEERAREVHEQARRTNAIALALLGEHGAALNRTGLHALPKLDTQQQKERPNAENPQGGIPNWETLFGAFDLCACQECSSAHGPAAYFVDILQFLKERGRA